MKEPKEFYRETHPNQFSDSFTIQVGELNRDFFDYFLESITSRSQEKEFEDFCRHIAEAEVCPNLLPQTGPTGGGDSKVDSETYPVAQQLAVLWYYGDGNRAATERWAFAISAKKDWKSKIRSDIAKIARVNQDENRGYTRIFFISNQYISDKKRSEIEDALRNQYEIDIRILDRTWLLDKTLKTKSNIEIAIKSFALSDSFADKIITGELDYKRKQEIGDIEERLRDQGIKSSEMVSLAQRSVTLARELEYSESQILGLIDRSIRVSREFGTVLDVANALYNAAWTMFWWCSNYRKYYEFYKEFEKITISEKKVSLFSNLVTLWINLLHIANDITDISIDPHTTILKEQYLQFTQDPNRPNTSIEAKASYQQIRYFLGDSPSEIVDDMIQLLDQSRGYLDLDIRPLCRVIQELPIFESANRYDELFEKAVSLLSTQKQEAQAALMLAKRGKRLKKDKPYEALTYFSRTLFMLYNEANKDHLTHVVLDIGDILQNVGLIWAARNFYYYDFCICLEQYMKSGKLSPVLFISADAIKFVEIKLGHILYALGFQEFSRIARHLYTKEVEEDADVANTFDFLLARQISYTPFEIEKFLCELPDYLDKHGLFLSSITTRYELGHYDETMLSDLGNNRDAYDDLLKSILIQPVKDLLLFKPWYGIEKSHQLQAKVLGCSIIVSLKFPYENGEVEIGASILATIESFLATGISNSLISLCGKINIELEYDKSSNILIKHERSETHPNRIRVVFKGYDSTDIIAEQVRFSDFLTSLLGVVISLMFPVESEMEKVKKLIMNDAALERSSTFVNSVFIGMETLGMCPFTLASMMSDCEHTELTRKSKSEIIKAEDADSDTDSFQSVAVRFTSPPDDFDMKNVSNADIYTSSIINIPLWNKSDWKGVMFITDSLHLGLPMLSLVFMGTFGNAIFDEWIQDIGPFDSENKIGIRIIKGIDKKHPYWYRVAIGPIGLSENRASNHRIFAMATRVHTMQPNSDENLSIFERELGMTRDFFICPSYTLNLTTPPQIYQKGIIRKKRDSILICNAHEIEENDTLSVMAIYPNDDPIIPSDKENAPISRILEEKRQFQKEVDN